MKKIMKHTQEWLNYAKSRLIEISKLLQDPNLPESSRRALYHEQCRLVVDIEDYHPDGF